MLTYLTATPGKFWIAPFTDVAQYAQERDSANLTTQVLATNDIQFTLTDTLDDTRFDEPLTVKVRVENNWGKAIATQAGQVLPVTLIQEGEEKYVLVNSVPDSGVVSINLQSFAGDYNGDGTVDTADYTVWRDSFGQIGTDLAADGDGSGEIDGGDYTVWTTNFGLATSSSSAVPEPSAIFLSGLLLSFTLLRPAQAKRPADQRKAGFNR